MSLTGKADIATWLQSNHTRPHASDGRGMIPIHPSAIPSWWRIFSQRYESFSNSLETFLRSNDINRLENAEVLTMDFQNMNRVILDRIYGEVDDMSSASGRSQWAMEMSKSSSTSSQSSSQYHHPYTPQSPAQYGHTYKPQIGYPLYTNSYTSQESPYSSPVYSYSCPSSISRQSYAQHLEGINVCLDALYFLLQAAQDLTDISPIEIRAQRLEELQLNPRSIRITELPIQLSSTINAVIRNMLVYDHGLIRKMMEPRMILLQLGELVGRVSEDGERPYWALGDVYEVLRRIREWRREKARSWLGAIWDWIVL